MERRFIENAIVESIALRFDRGVFLTSWVFCAFGGGGTVQGFGGYVMGRRDGHDVPTVDAAAAVQELKGNVFCSRYLCQLLRVLDVDDMADGKGKAIRVARDSAGWGARIAGIGHITKDIWLCPDDLVDETGLIDRDAA